MKDFLRSLLSRKFLLALGSFLTFLATNQYDMALYTVLAYLGVEGSADALERLKTGGKSASPSNDVASPSNDVDTLSDDVDTSGVWTGTTHQRHVDDIVEEAV